MLNIKHYISCVILLAAFGIPGGYLISLQVKQKIVRHEMLEKLERSHLQRISIATDRIQWYEEDKEIIVDGKMFDIKSSKVVNDSTIFYGLYDHEETSLKQQVESIVNNKSARDEKSQAIGKFLFQQLYVVAQASATTFGFSGKDSHKYSNYSDDLLYSFLPVFAPPPNRG